jgi:hypothetical protein
MGKRYGKAMGVEKFQSVYRLWFAHIYVHVLDGKLSVRISPQF